MPLIHERGVTMVGVTVGNLDNDNELQLPLPFDGDAGAALDAALDGVRDRFGSGAVTRGVLLGRGEGLLVPSLPD
jgi:DNA polymerase-4